VNSRSLLLPTASTYTWALSLPSVDSPSSLPPRYGSIRSQNADDVAGIIGNGKQSTWTGYTHEILAIATVWLRKCDLTGWGSKFRETQQSGNCRRFAIIFGVDRKPYEFVSRHVVRNSYVQP
jgi:hypothetical protein